MLGMKPEKDASLIVAIKEAVKKLGQSSPSYWLQFTTQFLPKQ